MSDPTIGEIKRAKRRLEGRHSEKREFYRGFVLVLLSSLIFALVLKLPSGGDTFIVKIIMFVLTIVFWVQLALTIKRMGGGEC